MNAVQELWGGMLRGWLAPVVLGLGLLAVAAAGAATALLVAG